MITLILMLFVYVTDVIWQSNPTTSTAILFFTSLAILAISLIRNIYKSELRLLTPSFLVVVLGATCNGLAVIFNGGIMPFYSDSILSTGTHINARELSNINLSFLVDWINVPIGMISVGDLCMLYGFLMMFPTVIVIWLLKLVKH